MNAPNPQRIPDPMLPTYKEWRFEIAEALGIKPTSVYMRVARGNHPDVEIVKINHQRQFVKETIKPSTKERPK